MMKKGALHRSIIDAEFVYFRSRARRQCEKALRCVVIDEGKFYFESVLFDIVKKRKVALEEMLELMVLWKWGRMVRDGDKEKAIGIFYNLVPRFLGFLEHVIPKWNCFSR